jgi:hypothetical protein
MCSLVEIWGTCSQRHDGPGKEYSPKIWIQYNQLEQSAPDPFLRRVISVRITHQGVSKIGSWRARIQARFWKPSEAEDRGLGLGSPTVRYQVALLRTL